MANDKQTAERLCRKAWEPMPDEGLERIARSRGKMNLDGTIYSPDKGG